MTKNCIKCMASQRKSSHYNSISFINSNDTPMYQNNHAITIKKSCRCTLEVMLLKLKKILHIPYHNSFVCLPYGLIALWPALRPTAEE